MEKSAVVEVFERGEATFDLTVEPPMAVSALAEHIKGQPDAVQIIEGIVGNLGVRLTNGKPLEDVLGPKVFIKDRY